MQMSYGENELIHILIPQNQKNNQPLKKELKQEQQILKILILFPHPMVFLILQLE
jgi:hypothetical protein